jgi:hypothetical protein
MMRIQNVLVLIGIAGTLGGCNDIGNAPAGMSDGDAKAAIANMKPEDRIRAINSSPMSATQKQEAYAEIERETGVKASDVLGGSKGSAAPGAGQ